LFTRIRADPSLALMVMPVAAYGPAMLFCFAQVTFFVIPVLPGRQPPGERGPGS
jgi:hypothetical protein